jgi:trans-aconitate 2-methyltransferase
MGCGPGNSTALLLERFPSAHIVGLDTSAAMLEKARTEVPRATFTEADAETWVPGPDVDLVFANAIYQWVPNHLERFQAVLAAMHPGAVLAVQMPDNLAEPTHQLMKQVDACPRWSARLASAARGSLPPVRAYFEALHPLATHLDIWHCVYNHVLAGPEAIVEWVRGTGLRPFVDPLSPEERTDYLARYTGLVARAYPATADGRVLLRFPRLFLVAVR